MGKMVAAFGFIEWFFIALLMLLTAASGVAALYIVNNLRKNPGR